MSFCGTTDTLVLDFWWHLLWVSKPEWAALFALGRGVHDVSSLRFISGVTPADLLTAGMAAKVFSSIYLQRGIGGAQNWDLSATTSQHETRQKLYQLPATLCKNETFC